MSRWSCRPRCRPEETGRFSIYLLAQEIPSDELSRFDLGQLALQEQPVLTDEGILAYSSSTHELELTDAAYQRIKALFVTPVKVSGLPFVVCVGAQRIYAGAFWTPLSSLSYDGVVILQPLSTDTKHIQIELGYPAPEAFTGNDPRADPRITHALEAAGKFKWNYFNLW